LLKYKDTLLTRTCRLVRIRKSIIGCLCDVCVSVIIAARTEDHYVLLLMQEFILGRALLRPEWPKFEAEGRERGGVLTSWGGGHFGCTKSPKTRLVTANALWIWDSGGGYRPQCPLATPMISVNQKEPVKNVGLLRGFVHPWP